MGPQPVLSCLQCFPCCCEPSARPVLFDLLPACHSRDGSAPARTLLLLMLMGITGRAAPRGLTHSIQPKELLPDLLEQDSAGTWGFVFGSGSRAGAEPAVCAASIRAAGAVHRPHRARCAAWGGQRALPATCTQLLLCVPAAFPLLTSPHTIGTGCPQDSIPTALALSPLLFLGVFTCSD